MLEYGHSRPFQSLVVKQELYLTKQVIDVSNLADSAIPCIAHETDSTSVSLCATVRRLIPNWS